MTCFGETISWWNEQNIPISFKPTQIPLITHVRKERKTRTERQRRKRGRPRNLYENEGGGGKLRNASFIFEGETRWRLAYAEGKGEEREERGREGRNSGESSGSDFLRLEFRIVEATLRPLGENRREDTNEWEFSSCYHTKGAFPAT